jgi:hypothetical protein
MVFLKVRSVCGINNAWDYAILVCNRPITLPDYKQHMEAIGSISNDFGGVARGWQAGMAEIITHF